MCKTANYPLKTLIKIPDIANETTVKLEYFYCWIKITKENPPTWTDKKRNRWRNK